MANTMDGGWLRDSTTHALVVSGIANVANTFTVGQTITPAGVGEVGLTLKQGNVSNSGNLLSVKDSNSVEGAAIDWDGKLYLGSGITKQAMIRLRGRSTLANPATGAVWELGLDSARGGGLSYGDFFIGRADGAGNIADFVYIDHGGSAMPAVGVGIVPPFNVNRGAFAASIWGNAGALPYHTILAQVQSGQTGKALAVNRTTDKLAFAVDVDGTTSIIGTDGTTAHIQLKSNGDIISDHMIQTGSAGWITVNGTGSNLPGPGVECIGTIYVTPNAGGLVPITVKGVGVDLINLKSDTNAIVFKVDNAGLATVSGGLSITDAQNIAVGTATGTKIGTATSQKIGLWNATPVVQPTTTGTTTGFTAASGTAVLSGSTFTGNTGSAAYTIGDIVNALKKIGAMAA